MCALLIVRLRNKFPASGVSLCRTFSCRDLCEQNSLLIVITNYKVWVVYITFAMMSICRSESSFKIVVFAVMLRMKGWQQNENRLH